MRSAVLGLFLVISALAVIIVVCQEKPKISSLHVLSDIKYRFATTLVTSHVLNPSQKSLEAVFNVTLPNDAFIFNFTIEIKGKLYPGHVKEKQAAQEEYQQAKKRGQTAAQVSQRPRETNRFKVEISVAPQENVTFTLTYQEVLERRAGTYDHMIYVDPGQIVEDLKIEVFIEESRELTHLQVSPISNDLTDIDLTAPKNKFHVERPAINKAYVKYHPSMQQQQELSVWGVSGIFTVRYDVSRHLDGGELLVVNGYFVHFIAPAMEEPVGKDVLFILDTSGSMSDGKLGQLKVAMGSILRDMGEGDRFAVMAFHSDLEFWQRLLVFATPRNTEVALEFVNKLQPNGWTNINGALLEGVKFLKAESGKRPAMVIFLTDGMPTTGVTNPEMILKNTLEANGQEMAIYSLAFGNDADWTLVKKLASQNNGVARRIYHDSDASLQIEGFYGEVSRMLLTGITVRYLESSVDAGSLTQSVFKNYFEGSELVVAGRLLDNTLTSLDVIVNAIGAEKGSDVTLALKPSSAVNFLDHAAASNLTSIEDLSSITERMWAYLTIKQILKQQVGETDAGRKEELTRKALTLSLKYHFVTPVTSMVVTKPEKDDVGDIEEDDSVLKDDGKGSPSASAPVALRGVGSGQGRRFMAGASRAAGGGDPHFMVQMTGLPYPICFDLAGRTGDVYCLLKDPVSGLTVNVELKAGPRGSRSGSRRVYIRRVAILLQRTLVVHVTCRHVDISGVQLTWNDTHPLVRLPGARVLMMDGVLRFVLDAGVEVDVARHVHPGNASQGADFLNVNVANEDRLGQGAGGLIGQFVHEAVSMKNVHWEGNKAVARLEIQTDDRPVPVQYARAILKERKDPYYNRTVPCLNLGRWPAHVMDHALDFFRVADLHST